MTHVPPPPEPTYYLIALINHQEEVVKHEAAGYGQDGPTFRFVDRVGGWHFYDISNFYKIHVVPIFENALTFDQVEALGFDGTGRS